MAFGNIQSRTPKGPYYFIHDEEEKEYTIYEKVYDPRTGTTESREKCWTDNKTDAKELILALNSCNMLARVSKTFLYPGQSRKEEDEGKETKEEEEEQ